MAQQTAVEWLAEELKSKGHALITSEGIFINVPNELLEQAKAMEKNQIAKAWDAGYFGYFSLGIREIEFNNGEEYYDINYNETYNK